MLITQKRHSHKRLDEQGFASIIIALILIIVLALLTVGFAQLARREQQSALDKQLANQANYAAESGINDIYQVVQQATKNSQLNALESADPNKCLSNQNGLLGQIPALPPSTINSTTGVSYTCVLLNLTPADIKYDNVAAQASRYITFSTDTDPGSFTFSWGSATGKQNFPATIGSPDFLPLAKWIDATHGWPAVLQVSITPLNGAQKRDSLINNTLTLYLYPAQSPGAAVYVASAATSPEEGQVVSGGCDTKGPGRSTSYPCQVTVSGMTGSGTGPYLIHITDYYDDSNIDITGVSNAGKPLKFADGQAQIDVTGQAKNVLKRLQVRVPIHPSASLPSDALVGTNICKRFDTAPTSSSNPNGTTPQPPFSDTSGGCNLN